MFEELLECRRCRVVGTERDSLCQPVLLYDNCLDHTAERREPGRSPCERIQGEVEFECAVCARPSIGALDVCYPRRRTAPRGG